MWVIFLASPSHAIDPRFELDPKLLGATGETPRREVRERKQAGRPVAGMSEYTIKPRDHIYLILVKEYGLTSAEAEALIPEVRRMNGVTNIRRLQIGQVLKIPLARPGAQQEEAARTTPARGEERKNSGAAETPTRTETQPAGHSLRMMTPAIDREPEGLAAVRRVWDDLVPATETRTAPLEIEDRNFSLSLDPSAFPSFPAADGGTVLVDAGGKMPPLVKALIEEKDPSIRIVSEDPRNRRRFMASLLAGARFYSVEENFSLDVGNDPKLTVRADFKIEKTADSLLRHEVVLLNVGDYRREMPAPLVQYLRKEGFQLVEPFPPVGGVPLAKHQLHQITAREARGIVDALLKSFNIGYDVDRNVELYGMGDGGVRLFVRADRYFEDRGERYVVSYFDGDPVSYTLTRLLEIRGYRVVMLDPKDDFRKVSEKLLTRLRMPGHFARHDLIPLRDAPYALQMSGYKMRGAGGNDSVILTNVEINAFFRDLLDNSGYTIITH
jgi:hypothetical protein